jgi:molecular chaperone GrpE
MSDTKPQDDEQTPASAAPDDPSGGRDPLEALRRERDALQDRLLRTAAEFDNFRKRMERERRDLSEHAVSDALADVLPVVDNFERALQVHASDVDAYRKGIELIHKQMVDWLRKRGVTPLDTTGRDFDPNFHQAVVREVTSDRREGEILEELQRGYMLGDRLLRPAMVKVAAQP